MIRKLIDFDIIDIGSGGFTSLGVEVSKIIGGPSTYINDKCIGPCSKLHSQLHINYNWEKLMQAIILSFIIDIVEGFIK